MRNLSKKAKTIIAGAAIAGLASAGGAYAYWTTTGAGTGTAATSAGLASQLTVHQTSTIENMFPGDAAQTIRATVKNTGTQSGYVSRVVVSIDHVTLADGVTLGTPSTCSATDYTLDGVTMDLTPGEDLAVDATSSEFSGATLKFFDKTTNQNACKGATVHLAYAAS